MIIISVIVLIIILLLFICYTVFIYHKMEICFTNNFIYFKFGIFKYKVKPKKEKSEDYIKIPKIDTLKNNIKRYLSVYLGEKEEIVSIFKDIFKCAQVNQLNFAIDFGTGDASLTAISYGVIWQIIAVLYKSVINKHKMNDIVNIAITPDYENCKFNYKIKLIANIKLFNFIKIIGRIKKVVDRNKLKFR